ncbi:MAG: Gfo/Idh/MocA family oxidoreductase [Terriglobia bacterium]|jgi:predicted dehydrogenase
MKTEHTFTRREFLEGAVASASGLAIAQASPARGSVSTRRWKYGVVGSGTRSRNAHLPILRDYFPEVEVVALSDVTPENLQQGLKIYGKQVAAYSDYREMLSAHQELDAVVVVAPNFLHAPITLAALGAGKHVLTEKPIATHVADATQVIATAKKQQRILAVGFEMRYSLLFHRMADLLRQGAIGDLELVFAALFRGDWNPRSWRYTDPQTGINTNWRFLTYTAGCSLMEDGIHELDVIHWLVNASPKLIQAQGGNNVYRDRETIDNAGVLIEFANQVRCNFGFSLFAPAQDGLVMRFYGSKGEMTFRREPDAQYVVLNPYRGKSESIPVPYYQAGEEEVWNDLLKRRHADPMSNDNEISTYRVHREFLKSLETGASPFADGEGGRDAIHIALAAEHSLRSGQAVTWGSAEITL